MNRFLLLAAIIAAPLFAQNTQKCPWMNAATAAGILDGAVTATIAHPDTCDFVLQKAPASSLEIKVDTKTSVGQKCGANATPLNAIGNEAEACLETSKNGERIERVIGRVRDQAFVIRISTKDASLPASALLEKARIAAEQVAGNLF